MKADDYIVSQTVQANLKKIVTDATLKNPKEFLGDVKSLAADAFNNGFVEGVSYRKTISEVSATKKSKELTNLTPSKFKDTETCKSLVELLMGCIETHSDGNVLDLGYEMFLQETAEKAFQIAYGAGISAGFGIASDPTTAAIYVANEERILKQGLGGNK